MSRSLLLLLLPLAATGADTDWRGFRGTDGTATAAKLPLTWSDKENVAWKTPCLAPAPPPRSSSATASS